jgi:hypothetical protein
MTTLCNGIRLPAEWPPKNAYAPGGDDPMPVPYLDNPPDIIPIDVGRQLFVDDFLIADSTLSRTFHNPVKFDGNPIMRPETEIEQGMNLPVAAPKSGGIWWDPEVGYYRMWYDAGWSHKYAYATSGDGLHWERHGALTKGNNHILPDFVTNSSTAFLDCHETDLARRFKMFIRQPDRNEPEHEQGWTVTKGRTRAYSMYSGDGIHWSDPVVTGKVGDRSTVFYNPFRRKWVFSIRSYHFGKPFSRTRHYRECDDLIGEAMWQEGEDVFWTRADGLDPQDPEIRTPPQLYNLDAVGYESLMLGIFEIHLGPHNDVCAQGGFPKIIDLKLGFSRDGFHWHRPGRDAFIASTRKAGDWDRGYVQSVGGCCLVFENELRFYYSGFMGDESNKTEKEAWNSGMYANACTGIATLRRDGFASLDADKTGGTLTTRPLTFNGEHLFVNVDASKGELRAEITDENGTVYPGFGAEECLPVKIDSCKTRITWKNKDSLAPFFGKPVRFRFFLTNAHLYSFWVSKSQNGNSGGYLGAGSPDYPGHQDG